MTSEHEEAADTAETSRSAESHSSGMHGLAREVVIVVGTAHVLSLLIKTFFAQAFFIPSESMEDTLLTGDRVLVSLLEPGPFELDHGDVVVFKDPGGWLTGVSPPQRGPVAQGAVDVLTFVGILPQDAGEHLIKRVIGLPGDRVVCCDDSGRLEVNGVGLDEPYLADGAQPSELEFDVTVPDDRLWVMGDNRQFSRDSRWHQDLPGEGTIAVDSLVGRAVVVFWPWPRRATLPSHSDIFTASPSGSPAPAAASTASGSEPARAP
jgi:signal peptidase I